MKAAKKRPRHAKPRKPAAKKPVRKVATRKAAPKPRVKRTVQRRLIIRFADPSDVDWLGAQSERLGLGDAKGPGAATYARMLIRAARECGGDPIDLLRLVNRPRPVTAPPRATARPPEPPMEPQELAPEGEPVDVDGLVDEVVSKVQDDRGLPMEQEIHDDGGRPGGVRVFGARQARRAVDWGGR